MRVFILALDETGQRQPRDRLFLFRNMQPTLFGMLRASAPFMSLCIPSSRDCRSRGVLRGRCPIPARRPVHATARGVLVGFRLLAGEGAGRAQYLRGSFWIRVVL